MKQTKTLLALLAVLTFSSAKAQNFETGGIVYGITSEHTVEVLSNYYLHNTPYSGSIVIPQTVEHDGIVSTTALSRRCSCPTRCAALTTMPFSIPASRHYICRPALKSMTSALSGHGT